MASKWQDVLATLRGDPNAAFSHLVGYSGALSQEQLVDLCQALRSSRFTGGLRFKECKLGDHGAAALAEALLCNRLISSIELPGNEIGKDGALALCRLVEANKSLTGFDISDNPCEDNCPELMHQIDLYVDRNRELTSYNGSGANSPQSVGARMQRSKARIIEVSPDVLPGVYSPKAQSFNKAHGGLYFGSDFDRCSTRSEQHSARTDMSDLPTRINLLEQRQQELEAQADALETEADNFHTWQTGFEQNSKQAMESLLKHEAEVKRNRKDLDELINWRGSLEMILEVNSAKIQRQGGDFHGLRDKVMKLHSEFERLHRRASLNETMGAVTPDSRSSVGGTPRSLREGADGPSLQELSRKIHSQNETHKELLDEFNRTRAMLEEVMKYYEGCENANATSRANFNSRLAALEKIGIIAEEEAESRSALSEALNGLDHFRTAIELQVEKLEQRIALAEVEAMELQQKAPPSAAELGELRTDIERVRGEINHRFDAELAQQREATSDLNLRLQSFEVAALSSRKETAVESMQSQYDHEKLLVELQNQVQSALITQRTLEDRVNFQDELIMDKNHGEQNLDEAIASNKTRLDTIEGQLQNVVDSSGQLAQLDAAVSLLKASMSKRIEDLEAQGSVKSHVAQLRSELQACALAFKQDLEASSQHSSQAVENAQGQLRQLDARLKAQLTASEKAVGGKADPRQATEQQAGELQALQAQVQRIAKQVEQLEGSMQSNNKNLQTVKSKTEQELNKFRETLSSHFKRLDEHLNLLEHQSLEAIKGIQAAKDVKSTVASKLQKVEAEIAKLGQSSVKQEQQSKAALENVAAELKTLKQASQETQEAATKNTLSLNALKEQNSQNFEGRLPLQDTELNALKNRMQQCETQVSKIAHKAPGKENQPVTEKKFSATALELRVSAIESQLPSSNLHGRDAAALEKRVDTLEIEVKKLADKSTKQLESALSEEFNKRLQALELQIQMRQAGLNYEFDSRLGTLEAIASSRIQALPAAMHCSSKQEPASFQLSLTEDFMNDPPPCSRPDLLFGWQTTAVNTVKEQEEYLRKMQQEMHHIRKGGTQERVCVDASCIASRPVDSTGNFLPKVALK